MMKLQLRTLLVAVALAASGAQASPSTDILGACLSDNTTGKDRKDLARWIFVGMSAHPEIGSVAKASAKDTEMSQRAMGALFTRLLGDQCGDQVKAVVRADGSEGVKVAFEYLGRMAMQELMSNPEVNSVLSGFERYVDRDKLD